MPTRCARRARSFSSRWICSSTASMRPRTSSSATCGAAAAAAGAGASEASALAAAVRAPARPVRRRARGAGGCCRRATMRFSARSEISWGAEEYARREDALDGTDLREQFRTERAIGVYQRVGVLAAGLVEQVRDVDAVCGEAGGDLSHHVRDVAV